MPTRTLLTFVALIFALAAASSSAEIYKWTDEEGNVHYSDRPTGGENTERMAIRSRPTDPAKVQAERQARHDARVEAAEMESTAPQGPSPEVQQADAEDRAEKCERYRAREFEFTRARRIYKLDEGGDRVYYTEDEMAEARAKVEALVDEYCN